MVQRLALRIVWGLLYLIDLPPVPGSQISQINRRGIHIPIVTYKILYSRMGVVLATRRYVRASLLGYQRHPTRKEHEVESQETTRRVLAALPRHAHPTDIPKSMIQGHPIRFISTLSGAPTLWNPILLRWDSLVIGNRSYLPWYSRPCHRTERDMVD